MVSRLRLAAELKMSVWHLTATHHLGADTY